MGTQSFEEKMKLIASILVVSAHAQSRGREGKQSADNAGTDDESFAETFNDYFGGSDYNIDYSGLADALSALDYNDAYNVAATTAAPTTVALTTADPFAGYDFSGLADALADYDSSYDGLSAEADNSVADIVTDAGRPDGNDDDETKGSAFIQTGGTIQVGHSEYASYCWINTAEADLGTANHANQPKANDDPDGAVARWFDTGNWHHCSGENEVCQIKVTRRMNNIFSIVSKCANNYSCVDNMKQNFAPAWDPSGSQKFMSSWGRQNCRPTFGFPAAENYNGANGNARARGASKPSECYFCVEPCRAMAAVTGTPAWVGDVSSETNQRDRMAEAYCIGKAADGLQATNSRAFDTYDIFVENTQHDGYSVTSGHWDTTLRYDGSYLSTNLELQRTDIHGFEESLIMEVSNIQAEQIHRRIDDGTHDNLPNLAAGADDA